MNEIMDFQQGVVGLNNQNSLFSFAKDFEEAQRMAKVFSASQLVPKEFQNNIGNCLIAMNMANRMKADPFTVMQNMYIVHGKPSWSSSFLISTFNACGRFSALRYEWSGEPGSDERACKAWAIEKETDEKLYGSEISISMAKSEGWYSKSGSKWKTMPDQMLMYRAATFFIRTYAPELAMGMQTQDELLDVHGNVIKRFPKNTVTRSEKINPLEDFKLDDDPIEAEVIIDVPTEQAELSHE